MAFQIYDKPGIGQTIGAGLGAGIGTGIQGLVQQKLGQMQKSTERKGIAKGLEALGFSPQESEQLSNLEPTMLNQIVKSKLEEPQRLGFAQALGIGAPAGMEGMMPQLTPEQAFKARQLQMQEEAAKAKQEFQEKKLLATEKKTAFKETAPYRKDVLEKGNSAEENAMRYERMKVLNEKGKLSSPVYVNLLEKLGWDIPALMSPDSGEFQKLTIDFLRDARKMFGARVTNFEASTFLKSIPSLKMTKEQRRAVIKNLEIMNEIAIERSKIMRQIIKENKGTPHLDLAEQVEERLAPQVKGLADKFKKNVEEVDPDLKMRYEIEKVQPAAENEGKEIKDKQTGLVFKSNGTEWEAVRKE